MFVVLYPPAHADVPATIKLTATGRAVFPDKAYSGAVRAITEGEARDLEKLGWHREIDKTDLGSLRKMIDAETVRAGFAPIRRADGVDLLYRAAAAQFRHSTGQEPPDRPRRLVFGEVETAKPHGRVTVTHDQGSDEIIIHGVAADLGEIDSDLRGAFRSASAAHVDAKQDSVEQSDAKSLLGVVVGAILRRHDDFIGSAVRRQRYRGRYEV